MSMSKKLYVNFGIVLAMVVVLFLVTLVAVQREQSAKASAAQALQMTASTDKVGLQIMQNRLYLSNYLLSGDSREVEHMNEGVRQLREYLQSSEKFATSDKQRADMQGVQKNEEDWLAQFAQPMLQKRKQVDSGNATVADLQIYYLQKDPTSWVKTSTDLLDAVDHDAHQTLEERENADKSAGTLTIWIALLATLVALALGIAIAYRTALSITTPLSHLIKVAQQIGESGDLEHEIDFRRNDEIGQLGRTFGGMVTYLKEMASVSEAIAGGNLAVEVKARSTSDTLGSAFTKMTDGLRGLVRNVRDAATQVASASSQVAGASDESAKISCTR
jgi:methyl-accepting chemotaxis protein